MECIGLLGGVCEDSCQTIVNTDYLLRRRIDYILLTRAKIAVYVCIYRIVRSWIPKRNNNKALGNTIVKVIWDKGRVI
jgi:hypothetical protein